VAEAVDYVKTTFERQVERAEEESTPPNTALLGDTAARQAFLTLLSNEKQRELFLSMIRSKRFLPRIRTLVGSPPFVFLTHYDDNILRASGIAPGRIHMSMTTRAPMSNYNAFGKAHYVDAASREYKVISALSDYYSVVDDSSPLPYLNIRMGSKLVLETRLKKRSLIRKREIAHGRTDIDTDAIKFPTPGTRLHMRPSGVLESLTSEFHATVHSLFRSGVTSSVSRLLVVVM